MDRKLSVAGGFPVSKSQIPSTKSQGFRCQVSGKQKKLNTDSSPLNPQSKIMKLKSQIPSTKLQINLKFQ